MVLDPLSALSLGSNVIQFVDFTSKLLSKSQRLYKSADGALVENLELEAITENLVHLNKVLTSSLAPRANEGQLHKSRARDSFNELIRACSQEAEQLLIVLRDLKVAPTDKRWESFRQALKSVWKKAEIEELLERLHRYREQILMYLLVLIEYHLYPKSPIADTC
jgi:hypothetical protein